MSEVADALKALLGRLGSFFDLFDLSFFVSGSVAVAAIRLWVHLAGKQFPFELQGWLKVLTIILACYVGGHALQLEDGFVYLKNRL